jgi:hypothetical protein
MEYCLQKINQYYTKLKDKGVSFIFNSEIKCENEQIQFPKIKPIDNIIEGIKVIFDNINKDILDTIKKYLPKNINISDNDLSIIEFNDIQNKIKEFNDSNKEVSNSYYEEEELKRYIDDEIKRYGFDKGDLIKNFNKGVKLQMELEIKKNNEFKLKNIIKERDKYFSMIKNIEKIYNDIIYDLKEFENKKEKFIEKIQKYDEDKKIKKLSLSIENAKKQLKKSEDMIKNNLNDIQKESNKKDNKLYYLPEVFIKQIKENLKMIYEEYPVILLNFSLINKSYLLNKLIYLYHIEKEL